MQIKPLLLLLTFLSSATQFCNADVILPILVPGTEYRVAFITSTTRDATSTDIADYNAFVTSAANTQTVLQNLGTTWSVIGSTQTVSALANTGTDPLASTGVPIYLLDGTTRIADNYADLWDTSIDAALNVQEDGTVTSQTRGWAGTNSDGSIAGFYLGNSTARTSTPTATNFGWIAGGGFSNTTSRPFYGISGVLTASSTAAVPEPSSIAFLSLIGVGGVACCWRRKRSGKTQTTAF